MDYMFLIYHDASAFETVPQEAIDACMKTMYQIQDDARTKGVFKGGAGLGRPTTARKVHLSEGKLTITDGPFAETKEALGGYYVIECRDMLEAEYWATRIAQSSGNATIEIRTINQSKRSASDEVAAVSKA